MECLVQFFDDWLLVTHDGNLGIESVRVLGGPDDDWQHTTCGPRTTEAGVLRYLEDLGVPVPSTAASVATSTTPPGDPGSSGGVVAFLPPVLLGGALLLPAVGCAVWWSRRRMMRASTSAGFERWLDHVVGDDTDPRVSFSPEEKRKGLRRCGGQCEYVDSSGERCGVMHGINGMALEGDHMYPRSRNGKTILPNLAMLCPDHNRRKSDNPPTEEWVRNVLNNRTAKSFALGTVSQVRARQPKEPVRSSDLYEWEDIAA